MTIKLCLYEIGVMTLLSESVSGSQCHNTGIQGYQTPMGLKVRVNDFLIKIFWTYHIFPINNKTINNEIIKIK